MSEGELPLSDITRVGVAEAGLMSSGIAEVADPERRPAAARVTRSSSGILNSLSLSMRTRLTPLASTEVAYEVRQPPRDPSM
jgi:hypothetical protein